MPTRLFLVLVLAGSVSPVSASPGDCAGIRLAEIADSAGIRFVHDKGATAEKQLPETMGSGLAWLDYDGDGWLDLYLVQSGPFPGGARGGNRLYRNLGNGRFQDVTEVSGRGGRRYGQGVVAADFDGDRSVDLFVTSYGETAFLRNLGDGRFSEETGPRGLSVDGWSSSAALGDVEGDGDLDLYVTRYVEHDPEAEPFCVEKDTKERRYCDPSLFVGAPDVFMRNEGGGQFVDATAAAGLAEPTGRGLGVMLVDLDGDLRPEIYVANDVTLNLLFRNLGNGRFEDVSLISGAAASVEGKPEAGMGLAIGDVDRDGRPDLAVTNFDVETNTLYRNQGDLFFEDVSAASGFGPPSFNRLGFGIVLEDFNGDGIQDVFVANGHVFEKPQRQNDFAQENQLLEGLGGGTFVAARCPALEEVVAVHRGLALADFDNDGNADVGVQVNGGSFELWQTRIPVDESSWVGVHLEGPPPNTQEIGAVVTFFAEGESQTRWVVAGDSYQSSSERRARFAAPSGAAATLRVVWSDGERWRLRSPPRDRYVVLRRREPGR